jgi:hypothetical protein
VDGTWTPSATDLAAMESRIDKIGELKSKSGSDIKNPRQMYRQYVGILIGGQRFIYINGMGEKPDDDWRYRLQDVCDGGSSFWGVVYNVQSGSFSDLETNGVA